MLVCGCFPARKNIPFLLKCMDFTNMHGLFCGHSQNKKNILGGPSMLPDYSRYASALAYPPAVQQGSLHYTPEHCLVNGGFPLCWCKNNVSNGCKMYRFEEPCPTSRVRGWRMSLASRRRGVVSLRGFLLVAQRLR